MGFSPQYRLDLAFRNAPEPQIRTVERFNEAAFAWRFDWEVDVSQLSSLDSCSLS